MLWFRFCLLTNLSRRAVGRQCPTALVLAQPQTSIPAPVQPWLMSTAWLWRLLVSRLCWGSAGAHQLCGRQLSAHFSALGKAPQLWTHMESGTEGSFLGQSRCLCGMLVMLRMPERPHWWAKIQGSWGASSLHCWGTRRDRPQHGEHSPAASTLPESTLDPLITSLRPSGPPQAPTLAWMKARGQIKASIGAPQILGAARSPLGPAC